MLYPIFKDIRTALQGISELKNVQWYNAQYDSTIHQEPVAFVEFPEDVVPAQESKASKSAPIRVRVHVASKVITQHDTAVPDVAIKQNETIAGKVKDACNRLSIASTSDRKAATLHWTGWRHYHRWQGWMVTFVDFELTARWT